MKEDVGPWDLVFLLLSGGWRFPGCCRGLEAEPSSMFDPELKGRQEHLSVGERAMTLPEGSQG